MDNNKTIIEVHRIAKTAEELENALVELFVGKELNDAEPLYQDIVLNRLEELQRLVVSVTANILQKSNEDDAEGGSAFSAGELTTEKKPDEE